MIIEVEKILSTKEEFEAASKATPYEVACLTVQAISNYQPDNPKKFYEILQVLMTEYQPISNVLKTSIRDCMMNEEKWKYIGKSYFEGAKPGNDYTPTLPYAIIIGEGDYPYEQEGYARVFLQSGGADIIRPIVLRQLKNGNWALWSDSILGLLAGIRAPESTNPWA